MPFPCNTMFASFVLAGIQVTPRNNGGEGARGRGRERGVGIGGEGGKELEGRFIFC